MNRVFGPGFFINLVIAFPPWSAARVTASSLLRLVFDTAAVQFAKDLGGQLRLAIGAKRVTEVLYLL